MRILKLSGNEADAFEELLEFLKEFKINKNIGTMENHGILDTLYVDGILRIQTNIGCIRSMIERTL